jgi:hypothetical protein
MAHDSICTGIRGAEPLTKKRIRQKKILYSLTYSKE